jgi:hypothetical protein
MTKIPKTRCSSLDRVFACPGSILPGEGPREAGGPDAILGRARHEALSYIPQGIDPPVGEIAAKYGVDYDEIDQAVTTGRITWDEIGVYFPDPMVECSVESKICKGTTDLIQVIIDYDLGEVPQALRLLDWKTGRGTDYHPYQLKGYAHCAAEQYGFPQNGVVTVYEVWTSHRKKHVTNLDREELAEFAAELARIQKTAAHHLDGLEYRAGAHCRFCPHRVSCTVNGAWLRESTTAMVAVDHGRPITRQMLGELYCKGLEVDRAMRKFWAAVGAALDDAPLVLPDGRRVERVTTEREKIEMDRAIFTLRTKYGMTIETKAELLGDLPKKRLDAWAKANAPKGKKKALLREVYGLLREAGAIRTEPHRQREILDAEPESDDG